MTVLAPLVWAPSPNYNRVPLRRVTHLVWHSTIGGYHGSVNWLQQPRSKASAHLVVDEHGDETSQLVKLADEAWHAELWDPVTIGVEHASVEPGFHSRDQFDQSARLFAWLCHTYDIPPLFGLHRSRGIVRHRDLGKLGGGHSDGPSDQVWFHEYLPDVQYELLRGGFRKTYAK